jgi:hypothetical protein
MIRAMGAAISWDVDAHHTQSLPAHSFARRNCRGWRDRYLAAKFDGSNAAPLEGQLRNRCNTSISHLHLKSVNESSKCEFDNRKGLAEARLFLLRFLYLTVMDRDFEVIAPELFQFFTTIECDPLAIEM